jgi:hypothetical protein
VKLPKTFLAVNLSDAFTFQEKQHQGESEALLEMKPAGHEDEEAADVPITDSTSTSPSDPPKAGEGAE